MALQGTFSPSLPPTISTSYQLRPPFILSGYLSFFFRGVLACIFHLDWGRSTLFFYAVLCVLKVASLYRLSLFRYRGCAFVFSHFYVGFARLNIIGPRPSLSVSGRIGSENVPDFPQSRNRLFLPTKSTAKYPNVFIYSNIHLKKRFQTS